MSHRGKRRHEPFDPTASDPEDLDWDGDGSPDPRPQKRRAKPLSGSKKKAAKRQRRGYNDSESDIVNDDDIDTEDSFSQNSEEDEEPETNPNTGRAIRRTATRPVTYEESEEDDIKEEFAEEGEEQAQRPRKSLVVTLKMKPHPRTTRTRAGSKPLGRGRTPEAPGTRRSSRISHDTEDPIIALSDSGRHVQIVRKGTHSPEPMPSSRRPTRGSKGIKKPPSAIMEASQEASMVHEDTPGPLDDLIAATGEDTQVQASEQESPADPEAQAQAGELEEMEGVVMESEQEEQVEDSDEGPVTRGGRSLRPRMKPEVNPGQHGGTAKRKRGADESSDFEPAGEEDKDEDMSDDDKGKGRRKSTSEESGAGRRSTRLRGKTRSSQRSRRNSDTDDQDSDLDPDELAEEVQELTKPNKRRRIFDRRPPDDQVVYDHAPNLRKRKTVTDYRIFKPENALQIEEDDGPAAPAPRPRGGRSTYRSLFSTQGPFGGGTDGPLTGPGGVGIARGADSDSSDDEIQRMPRAIGGTAGMTPTTATAPHFMLPQAHGADPQQTAVSGSGPANFGKVKDKKALADADPLGVDPNVNFDAVGGLDDHINQLKEMVLLPLLYPEVFQQFHITPPRGVLFHGPPGTGKTLLARALASSVSSHGQKVTFYMRKGADALSKWVGEAERQLRLLFEEARKTQPSIIFFDEIDGLAPVRSSKQEQIHASIVATLLALMDGMDGRGQVIVIGATNRPDSVDSALRRPGRFDREFYFPLPNVAGRRAIIDIHTKGWDPPLKDAFKDQLAEVTKGYGGADLRALCTEAALNAVQGTFPQIYQSERKLEIDPSLIKVLAKDFMISVNKIVPSSERTASSGAAPLPKGIAPLLRRPLEEITKKVDEMIPRKKKLTALQEAEFDDRDDEGGFEQDAMMRTFESARVFRPRLLITGLQGMGQHYLGAAVLNKLEGLHVQSFDLPTILEDATRTPEAAVIQLFKEVRRHKPSVIYIPNVDTWYETVGESVIKTFKSLLRTIHANEPVLVLGMMEQSREDKEPDAAILRDLFGFSPKNKYELERPGRQAREEFFEHLFRYMRMKPDEFPDPDNRKKRALPQLKEAAVVAAPLDSKQEAERRKWQKKQDRMTLNKLKIQIQPVMDQLKRTYRKFFKPIVDEQDIYYLFEEQDANHVSTDLPVEQQQEHGLVRPYIRSHDGKGREGILHVQTNRFFYNLDLTIIEKRLSNGYYKRPQDFLADIKTLAKDAKTHGDAERTIKANEMQSNVEVDMEGIKIANSALAAECDAVYTREQERARREQEKNSPSEGATGIHANVPPQISNTTTETSGPITLGVQVPGQNTIPPVTPVRALVGSDVLSNGTTSVADSSKPRQSNGSTVPSGPDEDSHMADTQEPGSQLQTPSRPATQTQPQTQTQKSQVSARTFIAPNSNPNDYRNSASTTTSGQKSGSDNTQKTGSNNTQDTNGVSAGHHPDFARMMPQEGSSQIPDTQEVPDSSQPSNSQPSQASSQQQFSMPAPNPPRHGTAIESLLNNENEQPHITAHATFIFNENELAKLQEELLRRTSGLSVEQLEQVNASLMDALWTARKEWNRMRVMNSVMRAFNEVIKDIEAMQAIEDPSQGRKKKQYYVLRDDPPTDHGYATQGITQGIPSYGYGSQYGAEQS